MNEINAPANTISATSILSGLGSLDREEICTFVAILEEISAISLARGALEDVARRARIINDDTANATNRTKLALVNSPQTDEVLRHRLWVRLSEALMVPTTVPLSTRSAQRAAAALAVRTSERLTPSVAAQRKKARTAVSEAELAYKVGKKAADLWNAGKKLITRQDPLPFPDLVLEEMVNLLADEDLYATAQAHIDPKFREDLQKAHSAAKKAMAAGGGWVAFAAIVGNAGFLPYMLAAQLSAWIPMVGGPTLVSLLATLINPLTVLAGVGALSWLAMGKGSQILRSQVAARLCVLLSLPGEQNRVEGLNRFLADMRALDHAPSASFDHLSKDDRKALGSRLKFLSGRLPDDLPSPAGSPPPPWNVRPRDGAFADAAIVFSLTAGEMLWHAVAIDENVLQAADFSRAADLSDPLSFAAEANGFLLEAAGYSLRGYVAERLVLDALVANGHDVVLAEASNTPGLDLIVDGHAVQVKCGSNLSNLVEHFEKYPDIPVIANEELTILAAESGEDWANLVTTLPGFEIMTIEAQVA